MATASVGSGERNLDVPNILTIIGARPQFIKAAPVSRALVAEGVGEVLVHTGQHFDAAMSDVFFEELEIPAPAYNLEVDSLSHGAMTGRMLEKLEQVMLTEKPDMVLVYGDTNSTIAAALAAAKRHIPVAHVEAGLRSFNRRMPEEINRVVTDHLSTLLFCPTLTAEHNLAAEGITDGVHVVGDVMYDMTLCAVARAEQRSVILETLGVSPRSYAVSTIHRAENTDDPERLAKIMAWLGEAAREISIVMPLHPPHAQADGVLGYGASRCSHNRSAWLSRHDPPGASRRSGVHRFRWAAEGGLFSPGSMRDLARRNGMGRDHRGRMEPLMDDAGL